MEVSRSKSMLELEVQDSRSKEKGDESEFEIGIDSRTDHRTTRVDLTGKHQKKEDVRIREARTIAFLLTETVDKNMKGEREA